MKLSSLLHREHIVFGLKSTTLTEAIEELLEQFDESIGFACDPSEGYSRPCWRVAAAVLEREEQSSTALGSGVAIPHARIAGLNDYYVLLGIPREPLRDTCPDGTPIRYIFVILGNEKKNALILQTMAGISTFALEERHLSALGRARSPREAWQVIDHSGIQVKEELRARDMMRAPAAAATEEMTLSDLLDLFFEHEVRVIPVLTEGGGIAGAVTSLEILQAGFPEYMYRFSNIGFLDEHEAFTRFLQQENTFRVRDFMNRKPLVFDEATPLIQIVFQMNRDRTWFAFIQDQGKLTGIIDRHDILIRLLRL